LYAHQTEAIHLARLGHHVIVTTATASGKSLCYNAPVLETLLLDAQARALYLFPTKALAQDQRGKLEALGLFPDVVTATYDGDTPREERTAIKRGARLIITNPDMLHVGILPYHTGWGTFFRNLAFVVVDEAHVYRGVFGAHVANILRRLRRVCAMYDARPQFLACSATIANPGELFGRLTGLDAEIVSRDGAPTGKKHFVFWNPPVHDPASGARRSSNAEATTLFTTLVGDGVRTIAFTRARKTAELLLAYSRQAFARTTRPELGEKIISYRAGYTPAQRREIERRLFNGDLTGVTATNALELGVDIGGVDACVLTGYPGTSPRPGSRPGARAPSGASSSARPRSSADNPRRPVLDAPPPTTFRQVRTRPRRPRPDEPATSAPAPPLRRLRAPLTDEDCPSSAASGRLHLCASVRAGAAAAAAGSLRPRDTRQPHEHPLACATSTYRGRSRGGTVLGTVEEARAFETLHPGAVLPALGDSTCGRVDTLNHRARVRPAAANYFTEPRTESFIEIKQTLASKEFGNTVAYFGEVVVTTQVVGYRQKQLFSDEVLGVFDLDLPEQRFETEAVWYPVSSDLVNDLARANLDLAGGVHAVEHASIGLLPLFALCDRNDIGGVSTPFHPQVGAPTIFVHDAHPGGVGIAETGFRVITDWLTATKTLLDECPCHDGCPSCIQSPKCGNNNEPLDKAVRRKDSGHILRTITRRRRTHARS
jgi:DEAD/DEAH box helicase domain-containing protein